MFKNVSKNHLAFVAALLIVLAENSNAKVMKNFGLHSESEVREWSAKNSNPTPPQAGDAGEPKTAATTDANTKANGDTKGTKASSPNAPEKVADVPSGKIASPPSQPTPRVADTKTPSQGVAVPTANSNTSAKANSSVTKKADESVAAKAVGAVKTWFNSAWNKFAGEPKSSAPVANSTVNKSSPTAVAPAVTPSTTGSSVAPAAPVSPGVAVVVKPVVPAIKADQLQKKQSGVAYYEIKKGESIPRLDIGREERVRAKGYKLNLEMDKLFKKHIAYQFDSPDLMKQTDLAKAMKPEVAVPLPKDKMPKIKMAVFQPKGKISRDEFEKFVIKYALEKNIDLKKIQPLSEEDTRLLSGIFLFKQGNRCSVAIGLFHSLSKNKNYSPEADYYSSLCSKELGLMGDFFERSRRVLETQDPSYAKKVFKQLGPELPYEYVEPIGKALKGLVQNKNTASLLTQIEDSKVAGNINFHLANYGVRVGDWQLAARHAALVPEKHVRSWHAKFILSLAEYQNGHKDKAVALEDDILENAPTSDKMVQELLPVVSLNLGRMYFQDRKFKEAKDAFVKVSKENPLWIQSLHELGWSQVQAGDFEGAIGNMYSIQSPYFQNVFKPESFVIRAIGYLNLCQYGDAYRTISILEKQYRPWNEAIGRYLNSPDKKAYQSVKSFLRSKGNEEIDGLAPSVVREMARHRDYTNLQNALNRQIDEKEIYQKLDQEVEKSLKRAQTNVTNSRKTISDLKLRLLSIAKNPTLEKSRNNWESSLKKEMDRLNDYFFEIDLYSDAKKNLGPYKAEALAQADQRQTGTKSKIESVLTARLKKMQADLDRVLENNELLRYEVFAGSGENIRYHVSGGESEKRVPASAVPKTKALQWEFDGEYWEDEIGHYRSSLTNNCPESKRAKAAKQAAEE